MNVRLGLCLHLFSAIGEATRWVASGWPSALFAPCRARADIPFPGFILSVFSCLHDFIKIQIAKRDPSLEFRTMNVLPFRAFLAISGRVSQDRGRQAPIGCYISDPQPPSCISVQHQCRFLRFTVHSTLPRSFATALPYAADLSISCTLSAHTL